MTQNRNDIELNAQIQAAEVWRKGLLKPQRTRLIYRRQEQAPADLPHLESSHLQRLLDLLRSSIRSIEAGEQDAVYPSQKSKDIELKRLRTLLERITESQAELETQSRRGRAIIGNSEQAQLRLTREVEQTSRELADHSGLQIKNAVEQIPVPPAIIARKG